MKKVLVVILICMIGMAGCSNEVDSKPTMTAVATGTPSLDETETVVSVTPSSTPTVLPTYTALESKNSIDAFLAGDNNCPLPCIFGIWPGSPRDEANNILYRFGKYELSNFNVRSHFFEEENCSGLFASIARNGVDTWAMLSQYFEDDKVSMITLSLIAWSKTQSASGEFTYAKIFGGNEIFSESTQNYSIHNVLSTYGLPSTIYIAPLYQDEDDPRSLVGAPVNLILVYEEVGFVIEYAMPRDEVGDTVNSCPINSDIYIGTWDTGNPDLDGISTIHRIYTGPSDFDPNYYRSIEVATGMTIEQFADLFLNDPNACFPLPLGPWQ